MSSVALGETGLEGGLIFDAIEEGVVAEDVIELIGVNT